MADRRERSADAGLGLRAQQACRRTGGHGVRGEDAHHRWCGPASCSARGTAGCSRCSGRSRDRACISSADPATDASRSSPLRISSSASCSRQSKASGSQPDVPGTGIYFAAAEDLSHMEFGREIARALGKPRPRDLRLPEWAMRAIGSGRRCRVARCAGVPGWVGRDKIRELLAGSWTCSSAKARQQLGWSPAAPLADRFRETAQWYRDAHWL